MSIFDTLTLGDLIDRLKRCPQDADARFDFCWTYPDGINSYRGFYEHLALGASGGNYGDSAGIKVSALLALLNSAVGKTFTGWKGGEYFMRLDTPVWVDNPGSCSGTAITDVETVGDYAVYLVTKHVE